MQKSARCRGLWWFRYSSACTFSARNTAFLHASMPSKERTQLQPSCHLSTRDQELLNGSIEEQYQHTKQLRQRNCWKLWHLKGLSVEEISCILHMRQDIIINIILSFERERENVDWHRLCKLVMLTTTTARVILVASSKAKMEMSALCGAALFSASDIKNFYPQNVTHSQINLVHVMLSRKLTSSEILDLASCTDMDFKRPYQAEATDLDTQRTYQDEIIANVTIRNAAYPEYDDEIKYRNGKETVDSLSPFSTARHKKFSECDCVVGHEEYANGSLNMSSGANGWMQTSRMCQEEKDMAYDFEGAKNLGFCQQVPILQQQGKFSSLDAEHQQVTDSGSEAVAGKKLVTMFDILQWLRNNDMATTSNIVNAFGYCEARHLLCLLLEMLESCIIDEQEGVLRIVSEQISSRLEEPTKSSQVLYNPSINRRMHRALCLKAVVLNVVIHEPKMNVEFIIRHIKADGKSTVYHIQICKHPLCTCPDFTRRFEAGLDYMPCKHLFYVYLVQLHLDKNHEHLMLQRILKDQDLERILEGHY